MMRAIYLFFVFLAMEFAIFSQELISIKNASTCNTAIEVSTLSKFGPTGPPKEIKTGSVDNPFERNHHMVWYKFKIEKDGILLFDIIPIDQQDNYDFVLYKIDSDNYCKNISDGKLKEKVSNMERNDLSINGMTGLSLSGVPDSYSKGIEVVKGEQYLLAINNLYKGKGHTIVFKYLENFVVSGIINYNDTKETVKAELFWTNLRTKETSSSVNAEKDGSFKLKVSVSTEAHRFPEYLLWAYSNEYYIADTLIASKDVPDIEKNVFQLTLHKLKKGNCDFLPKILFEPNDQKIKPESIRDLERVLRLMQQNEKLEIILEGHSNGFYPSTEVDKNLSEGRAEVVKNWLIENGIEPSRLATRGFGSEQMLFPMAQNEMEEGMNRRVEFFIARF